MMIIIKITTYVIPFVPVADDELTQSFLEWELEFFVSKFFPFQLKYFEQLHKGH